MNRFDIGVVVVTFVVLGVAAIIRNVVVPIVRLRARNYRLAAAAGTSEQDQSAINRQAKVQQLPQRDAELENNIALRQTRGPLQAPARDETE